MMLRRPDRVIPTVFSTVHLFELKTVYFSTPGEIKHVLSATLLKTFLGGLSREAGYLHTLKWFNDD